METRNLAEASEGIAEEKRRLPRLFRLDDHILTHMLLSRKPIIAVAKSILERGSSDACSVEDGQECFFFHAKWQAVC